MKKYLFVTLLAMVMLLPPQGIFARQENSPAKMEIAGTPPLRIWHFCTDHHTRSSIRDARTKAFQLTRMRTGGRPIQGCLEFPAARA
jgi:hypothetical protein